ncbi:hypothetical protein [Erythrobacter sp. R86502]
MRSVRMARGNGPRLSASFTPVLDKKRAWATMIEGIEGMLA